MNKDTTYRNIIANFHDLIQLDNILYCILLATHKHFLEEKEFNCL